MRHRPSAFTLVELVLSVAIMAILMTGMGSAILIATHALPEEGGRLETAAEAIDVVDRIAADLSLATRFMCADPDVVRFSVPDRGHGAAGPESIRYAWSGAPGDPLTHRYNGCPDITLCEDVYEFSLSYTRTTTELRGTPRVLLIVDDDAAPTAQEEAKRQMIESWGFTVQTLSDHRTLAEQEVALQSADVVYLAQDALTVPALLSLNPAVGIVCEERALFPDIGISTSSYCVSGDSIVILDNTHEITQPFAVGTLPILSASDSTIASFGDVAPGGRILAKDPSFPNGMLIAIELDGALSDGGMAPSRRVSLPWGDRTFDFGGLTKDGLTLMRRAIVWAAAPVVYSSVHITLQIGADASGRVETQVRLLNLPEAP
jgi:prepilin-type N-terminal cleavage/methylation domain-containing protein